MSSLLHVSDRRSCCSVARVPSSKRTTPLSREPSVQNKCAQMLKKIADIDRQQHLKRLDTVCITSAAIAPTPQHSIRDAEIVIRGPDGKRMFFKQRHQHTTDRLEANAVRRPSALVVSHPTHASHCESGERLLTKQQGLGALLSRRLWPAYQVLRIARIDARRAIVRVEEHDKSDVLMVTVYFPATCREAALAISLTLLSFVLPASLTWFRVREVRARYDELRC